MIGVHTTMPGRTGAPGRSSAHGATAPAGANARTPMGATRVVRGPSAPALPRSALRCLPHRTANSVHQDQMRAGGIVLNPFSSTGTTGLPIKACNVESAGRLRSGPADHREPGPRLATTPIVPGQCPWPCESFRPPSTGSHQSERNSQMEGFRAAGGSTPYPHIALCATAPKSISSRRTGRMRSDVQKRCLPPRATAGPE